jgi:crotonobetainyl-CoA:carnitine CoA-transferase CaiB-like acyl-CoA transferase
MARFDRRKPRYPINNYYECSDGKWLLLCESQFDRFWGEFCQVVGIEEPEYVNLNMTTVGEGNNRERTTSFLDKLFATKSRDEWLKIFEEKGARFVYAPVNEVSDLLHDEQVLANNYFVDFEHPIAGTVKLVGHPVEYSKTPARVKNAAPGSGQHTEEVLWELGYTRDDINSLREEEVI